MQPRTYTIEDIRNMRKSIHNANGDPTAQAPNPLANSAPQAPAPKALPGDERVEGLCNQTMAFLNNNYKQLNLLSTITIAITLIVIAYRLNK